ncbi:MAG: DUF2807 domain-containing protein [Flavisolibacter sp.]|jgi:hypothetical protein|nr:DUF2807 domain-containing protein [Flavisolibacter sp.]
MKYILLPLLVSFFCLPALAQRVVNDLNVESREVSGFKAVSISGPFKVILTQGNEEGLAVSADQKEDVEYIKAEVKNGVLKIWSEQKNRIWNKSRNLRAYISVKNIEVITSSGASTIEIDGSLSAQQLSLNLSGASDLKGKINVSGKLSVGLSGASDLSITGSVGEMEVTAGGASRMRAYDCTTGMMRANASGASSLQVTVEKELSAKLSGASSLRYQGSALIRDIQTSGASSIQRKS